jgi:hypothetical protein
MMSTTDLLVEYLVIGSISDIWLLLAILAFSPVTPRFLSAMTDSASKLSTLLVVPFLAFTYTLGGAVNFAASLLLKKTMQDRYRNAVFQKVGVSYYEARGLFFQEASEDVISRVRSQSHLIRLYRSSVLNFALLAIVCLFYVGAYPISSTIGATIFGLIAVSSFFNWRDRYESNFDQMVDVYEILLAKAEETE